VSSIDEQIEALNERRQTIREKHEAAHKAQHLVDLTALADLEVEHGYDRLIRVELRGWKADSGATTMAVALRARKSDKLYKRFVDMVRRSKKGEKINEEEVERAGDMLAQSCLVYPAPPSKDAPSEAYEATLELFPGLLTSVASAIVTAAMGKAEEEGKG
jgi:hypothetical protein